MNFDLRFPIGSLFGLYGVILCVFGLTTSGSELYARSLDINVNLIWGLVLLAFGAWMLLLAWWAKKKSGPK